LCSIIPEKLKNNIQKFGSLDLNKTETGPANIPDESRTLSLYCAQKFNFSFFLTQYYSWMQKEMKYLPIFFFLSLFIFLNQYRK